MDAVVFARASKKNGGPCSCCGGRRSVQGRGMLPDHITACISRDELIGFSSAASHSLTVERWAVRPEHNGRMGIATSRGGLHTPGLWKGDV